MIKLIYQELFSAQKSVLFVKEFLPVVLVVVVLYFLDSHGKTTKEAIVKA